MSVTPTCTAPSCDDVNLLGIRWKNTRLDNLETGRRLMQDRKGRRTGPGAGPRLVQEAEETYRDLRKASEAQGIFTMSGRYIQQELTMRRLQMPFWSYRRFASWIVDLFCGYGEAPMRVVLFSLLLIVICSIFTSSAASTSRAPTSSIARTTLWSRTPSS